MRCRSTAWALILVVASCATMNMRKVAGQVAPTIGDVTITPKPTTAVTKVAPTNQPTTAVTKVAPTNQPTTAVTRVVPTLQPTKKPTRKQTSLTPDPTVQPTSNPTLDQTTPTPKPTLVPTTKLTPEPTLQPTSQVIAPTPDRCFDDQHSSSETDIDCGGSVCEARCSLGKGCARAADCQSELWCGFAAANSSEAQSLGICVASVADVSTLMSCASGEDCIDEVGAGTAGATLCALTQDNAELGYCVSLSPTGPDNGQDGESTPRRWTPVSIVSTMLLGSTLSTTLFLSDGFLFALVLDAGQIAASGALLHLPSAPLSYTAFASSLSWTMGLMSGPLFAERAENRTSPSVRLLRRRLNDGANFDVENGVTYFAELAALNPSLLLCECLLLTMVGSLAYISFQLYMNGFRNWRKCVCEAAVRIPYMIAYPIMALSSYTVYLLFLTRRENDASMRAGLALLAFAMFVLGTIWLHVCLQHTRSDEMSRTFRALTIDWKEHTRLFWSVRVIGNAFRGLFVGLITRPTPLQASLFMVVNTSYLAILVYARPYKFFRTNRIAIFGAVVCLANTILLVIFAVSPQPFDDETMEALGILQICLTVMSFIFLMLVVASQVYHRWREARQARQKKKDATETVDPELQKPEDVYLHSDTSFASSFKEGQPEALLEGSFIKHCRTSDSAGSSGDGSDCCGQKGDLDDDDSGDKSPTELSPSNVIECESGTRASITRSVCDLDEVALDTCDGLSLSGEAATALPAGSASAASGGADSADVAAEETEGSSSEKDSGERSSSFVAQTRCEAGATVSLATSLA